MRVAVATFDRLNEIESFVAALKFEPAAAKMLEGVHHLARQGREFNERPNPVYGQGMSVAAQEALLLHQLLRRPAEESDPLAGLAPAFFGGACVLIETPWAQAAVADFSFPETKGQRPPDFARTLEFRAALTRLAARDPNVHKLMAEVQLLVKPPSVLRDPDLVERVWAAAATA